MRGREIPRPLSASRTLVALILACSAPLALWSTPRDGASSETLESPVRTANEASRPKGDVPTSWSSIPIDPLDYFEEEELAEWRAFRNRGRASALTGMVLSLVLYTLFAFTFVGRGTYTLASSAAGSLARLRPFRAKVAGSLSAALTRMFGKDWAAALLFTWLFLLATALAFLPLQLVAEHDARSTGLSVYTTPAWFWDLMKGLFLQALSLSFVVFGLFGLIRRMPSYWWLALGLPAALVMVAWGVASPYQARVFYEFSTLRDEPLRSNLISLARQKGIELTEIKVIDASRHTRGINAYVTGLGPSRELVLFDTTLELLEEDEVVAAFAHELGHVERESPLVRYSLSATMMLAMLWMLSLVLRRVPSRIGLDGPGDPRALPVLLLVVSLCFLVARPIERAFSRHEERLADQSALVLTQDPDAFIRLMVNLARHNRADVDPPAWVTFWFSTHPSILERIATARWYQDWVGEESTPSE